MGLRRVGGTPLGQMDIHRSSGIATAAVQAPTRQVGLHREGPKDAWAASTGTGGAPQRHMDLNRNPGTTTRSVGATQRHLGTHWTIWGSTESGGAPPREITSPGDLGMQQGLWGLQPGKWGSTETFGPPQKQLGPLREICTFGAPQGWVGLQWSRRTHPVHWDCQKDLRSLTQSSRAPLRTAGLQRESQGTAGALGPPRGLYRFQPDR